MRGRSAAAAILATLAGLGVAPQASVTVERTGAAQTSPLQAAKWATGRPRALGNSIMRALNTGRS